MSPLDLFREPRELTAQDREKLIQLLKTLTVLLEFLCFIQQARILADITIPNCGKQFIGDRVCVTRVSDL
jgi:hypothetical protein